MNMDNRPAWCILRGAGLALWGVSAAKPSDLVPAPRLDADDKLVYLIRHGITEMNCWLRDFRVKHGPDAEVDASLDPLLYDTRLTAEGVAGAKRLREKVARVRAARVAWLLQEGPLRYEPFRIHLRS